MSFTATDVKNLREKTGAGMMECKRALVEAKGDMQDALELLRKQGLAIAAKKSARSASEGTIGSWVNAQTYEAGLVEIFCETDFVAKNEGFQHFTSRITKTLSEKKPKDLDALLQLQTTEGTVKDTVTAIVAKIGENVGIRRFVTLSAKNDEKLGQYIHAGNKIGVLVKLKDPTHKVNDATLRDVAMHIAAMNPQYVRSDEVPDTVLAKEKEILKAQMADQKKPAEIIEKIVSGKMTKFFSEVCLEEQMYVKDVEGKKSVKAFLTSIDPNIRIESFVRYQVGESEVKSE
ncbi:MAG: translation elongation factor Ts [Deltaproteobacteria bacterium RIFCSPLOWO2_02_FULL_44_10]|nr:MAG: translation elongation factor Ts [Deltaproteobacteria bacterium RIFCSPHIGHO2_02_FULL_44_16]OGQ46397.1 MAG: translation elongation factor Ts [Deltaproteobacteria bacterium RIFCSPLOWO2_02_FULL_44_10]